MKLNHNTVEIDSSGSINIPSGQSYKVGSDSILDETYWTSSASSVLSNETNLGSLTTGLLKHTVSAGISTPATATDGTDYLSATTGLKLDQTTPQTIANGLPLYGTLGNASLGTIHTAMQEPTGFDNRTGSAWTFTDGTRKLSVTVVSGSYDIWFNGVKHTISTTKEITITDVEGIHMVYFDTDDTLKEYVNPTTADTLIAIRDKCLVGIVYWDATNKASVVYTEERHGTVMDGITHFYLHYTRGLQYVSGLALGDFVIGDGSLDTHAQFSITSGSISDEDIGLTTSAVGSTAGLPILYKDGANAYWRRTTQAGFAVKQSGSATNRLYYNQNNAGTWQLTEVGEGNYVLCHVYTYSGKVEQLFAIMGQNEYANLPAARTGATTEISAISLGNLPSPEMRPVATIIFQTDKDYANTINARIVEITTGGDKYVNWLTTSLPRGVTPSDHQSLSNLLLAQSGVTYGHIDDQTQTIAGAKTFSSALVSSISTTTPLIIGGTTTTSSVIYKTTTGVGTTGADHIFQVGNNGATEAMRILNSGFVGINKASPGGILHTYTTSSTDTPIFERLTTNTTGTTNTVRMRAKSTGNMSDDFASIALFQIEDDAGVANSVGYIGVAREGADNSGKMIFATHSAGTAATRMSISKVGDVAITSTTASTSTTTGALTVAGGIGIAGALYGTSANLNDNLTMSGSAKFMYADWSNATVANRFTFQSSTTDGNTSLQAKPNGSATTVAWNLFNSSDVANTSLYQLSLTSTTVNIISSKIGSGTYLPIYITAGGINSMMVDIYGSLILGGPVNSAIATNATAGFLYIPTCAGTPTGVPTAYTGKCAIVMDTTNHKLYVYDGSWLAMN